VATRSQFERVMADYTKCELRKAELARFLAAGLPPLQVAPICACGAPAVIEVNRWPRVTFFCSDHVAEAESARMISRTHRGERTQ
jgi:hypothetical protein